MLLQSGIELNDIFQRVPELCVSGRRPELKAAVAKERVMTSRILECQVTLGSAAEQLSFQRACSHYAQSCDSGDITLEHLVITVEEIFTLSLDYLKVL